MNNSKLPAVNKRRVGTIEERLAACFLEKHGVHIVDRNFHDSRYGEIDLIGYEGRVLVFAEVKYRSTYLFGRPEEAVTLRKQKTISNVARFYMYTHHCSDRPVRFDIVAISEMDETTDHVLWLRDAFPYRGK
ncbi:putative endonuclease [Lachnospiraceae bacterium NK3A20]|jgi:putative endonuclease|nr:putative endonuclease [Lachnospiraceae bacterium NK3A20]